MTQTTQALLVIRHPEIYSIGQIRAAAIHVLGAWGVSDSDEIQAIHLLSKIARSFRARVTKFASG